MRGDQTPARREGTRAPRAGIGSLVLIALLSLTLSGCATPPHTVKIALVAPFEGRQRAIGYAAFPALRLALRDATAAAPDAPVQVTFVAYDDSGDPVKATRIARAVVSDPDVVAVIGHLTLTPTLAALDVYTQAGLPVLVPSIAPESLPAHALIFRMGPSQARLAGGFDAPEVASSAPAQRALTRFTELSLGPPPTRGSIVAHDATTLLIAAIRASERDAGGANRAGVAAALRTVQHDGLLGTIRFDAAGIWREAPGFAR